MGIRLLRARFLAGKSILDLTFGLRYSLLQPVYEADGNQVSPDSSLNQFVIQSRQRDEPGSNVGRNHQLQSQRQSQRQSNRTGPGTIKTLVRESPLPTPQVSPMVCARHCSEVAGKSSIRGGFGIVYDHFGTALVDTFDQNGSFGLNTIVSNAAGSPECRRSVRYAGAGIIPDSSPDGVLFNPAPTGSISVYAPGEHAG